MRPSASCAMRCTSAGAPFCPTNCSAARVRATIVPWLSKMPTTQSGGIFWRVRISPRRSGKIPRARANSHFVAPAHGDVEGDDRPAHDLADEKIGDGGLPGFEQAAQLDEIAAQGKRLAEWPQRIDELLARSIAQHHDCCPAGRASSPGPGGGTDAAAVRLDDRAADGYSKPCSAPVAEPGLPERLEQAAECCGGERGPAIRYAKLDAVRMRLSAQHQTPGPLGELERVVEQVGEYAQEAVRIDVTREAAEVRLQRDALAREKRPDAAAAASRRRHALSARFQHGVAMGRGNGYASRSSTMPDIRRAGVECDGRPGRRIGSPREALLPRA